MRITFPFAVKQVGDKEVQVQMSPDGRPLVVMDLHPAVRELVTEQGMDDLHNYAETAIIKDTIKVTR
jgi:hemoglobin-like flavoprotein